MSRRWAPRARLHARAMAAAAVLGLLSTPGVAQTTAVAHGSPSNITLSIPVKASIASVCGFATGAMPSESFTIPTDLNNAFTHDVGFVLQCTVASRIAVVSSNGGLRTSASAPPGYTGLRKYNVALHVVGDTGVTPADANCASVALKPTDASCSFFGTATATVGLPLSGSSYNQAGSYLRVSSAAYADAPILLAANNYADTLTVTLSAAP